MIADSPVNRTITASWTLGLKLVTPTKSAPNAVPVIIIPILNHGEYDLLLPIKLRSLMSIPFSIRIIFSLNLARLIKNQAKNNPAVAINARVNIEIMNKLESMIIKFWYPNMIPALQKRLQNIQ